MPIDDLTALGQKMREARKRKDLTQQELSDMSHVSVKQIAKIEKGQMNPSFLILKALAKVLPISLDSLINPDVSPEDEGAFDGQSECGPAAENGRGTEKGTGKRPRPAVSRSWSKAFAERAAAE